MERDHQGRHGWTIGAARRAGRAVWPVLLLCAVTGAALYIGDVMLGRPVAFRPPVQGTLDLDAAPTGPSRVATPGAESHGAELRIAIAPVISPERSLAMYREFARYLADRLGQPATILQRRSYAEVNELVRDRRCDLAMVCTYPFVRGERAFGMQALVVPVIGGLTTYHSLIVVPAASGAESLLDLRGRRFGSADPMSNTGWLFPATWLLRKAEDPDRFFGDVVFTGSHDRTLLAVASGFVDGAAVDSLVYDQLVADDSSIAERTRVIIRSAPFGMPPLVVHPRMDPAVKRRMLEALLGMHRDPEGEAILDALEIDRFETPPTSLYDSVRTEAALWESRR